jgi:hypothetical protein
MSEDFIGIYENALTPKECQGLINHFWFLSKLNLSFNRQQLKDGPKTMKDDETVFLMEPDTIELTWGNPMMDSVVKAFWDCFEKYVSEYDALTTAERLGMVSCRLQRTAPGGGFHQWHFEQGSSAVSRRVLAWMVYLNDIEEGGETEFLYQHRRIKPKAGTIVIWPASFTHTHRGNPPLKDEKFILTGWIEFLGGFNP